MTRNIIDVWTPAEELGYSGPEWAGKLFRRCAECESMAQSVPTEGDSWERVSPGRILVHKARVSDLAPLCGAEDGEAR